MCQLFTAKCACITVVEYQSSSLPCGSNLLFFPCFLHDGLGRGWGLKSPHTLPTKGKGLEEKTRRRIGVISLAQVGGGVLQASPSTHPIMLIHVRIKASYLGNDHVNQNI